MLAQSTIIELCRSDPAGIFAVPYAGGRGGAPVRLPDGAIVEAAPEPGPHADAPGHPGAFLAIARDGRPATIHHVNLGLVASYVALTGVYLLSGGAVAAVYGARAEPIG
jgi:hypothetical protein